MAGDWPWTDYRPGQHRVVYFLRSGEMLTTACLVGYALLFANPDSTFAVSSAFSWLRTLVTQRGDIWAAIAVALAFTGPLALAFDSGTLRIASLFSQGVFFLLLANSVRLGAPPSLLFGTLIICGGWLVVRALALFWFHWHAGEGQRGERRGR